MVSRILLLAVSLVSTISAQQITSNGCLRLLGSAACPGFSTAYINPSNLSNAFPFFATVTDVKSFDAGAFDYFSNEYEFQQTKFTRQLGCSNASQAVIRYQRTVLCSMWVNEKWSSQCLAFYNGTSAATSQKMVCQQTCVQYATDESTIVNNPTYCPGPDLTNGTRLNQLLKDFTDCTNWTTLATSNLDTCVLGSTNEGNCGYGSSTTQLCGHCSGSSPEDCCYASNTDVSVCGYTLPVRVNTTSSSSSSSMPTASGTLQNADASSGTRLTGGQLAGTIVGSILGGLLLLALIIFLLLCYRRKNNEKRHSTSSSFAANQATRPQTGLFSSIMPSSNRSSAQSAPPNEKGGLSALGGGIGNGHYPNASSPTMGGDTLYSVGGGNKSSLSGVLGGAAAGVGVGAVGAGMVSGGGGGRSGIVLPRVRDENQGGDRWIETGAEVSVLWPYQAALPDELDLRPGMKLRVLRLYDDAWGTAQILSGGEPGETGRQGAFPIVCVSEGSSFGSSSPGSVESS